jgi:hypothetical protein
MLTITQQWLDLFPAWKDAGWEVSDQCDLANILTSAPQTVQDFVDAHPPHKPGN